MSGKILRLGFAMGGGVSLGTFSGAALTEAIKLILVDIINGKSRYSDVVIDVFSGASAGGMSLGAMFRGLYAQNSGQMEKAKAALIEAFGNKFMKRAEAKPELYEKLLATQAAQEVQHKAWVETIKIETLLDKNLNGLTHQAGILNRGAIESLACNLLLWEGWNKGKLLKRGKNRLLNKQVLFACTLTNTTALMADASSQFKSDPISYLGLRDGMRTAYHRDLRVFDLNIGGAENPDSQHPSRYLKMVNYGQQGVEDWQDLRKTKSWSIIASSIIACGAFPGAFEPVPLTRWSYEYGYKNKTNRGDWPEELGASKSHVFTFMDGGIFNNEPIREAFRLAAFIDSHAKPNEDYERRIIFVDPFVSAKEVSMFAPVNNKHHASSGHNAPAYKAASLDRLLNHLPSVVSVFMTEGRVVEADKIARTRNYFDLRDDARDAIAKMEFEPESTAGLNEKLSGQCKAMLDNDSTYALIPAGRLSFEGEKERVKRETIGQGDIAYSETKILLCVYLDLLMRLGGKSNDAKLIAVGPFAPEKPHSPSNHLKDWVELELKGAPIQGFSGFMSRAARNHDFQAGRYCAYTILRQVDLISQHIWKEAEMPGWAKGQLPPVASNTLNKRYSMGLNMIIERVSQMIQDSHIINLTTPFDRGIPMNDFLNGILKWATAKLLELNIDTNFKKQPTKHRFEVHMYVPSLDNELDGKGFLAGHDDVEAVKAVNPPDAAAPYRLVTVADYYPPESADNSEWFWEGAHVDNNSIEIDCDSLLSMFDTTYASLPLPKPERMKEAIKTGAFGVWCVVKTKKSAKKPTWNFLHPTGLEEELLAKKTKK
jgi:hypothetical protein